MVFKVVKGVEEQMSRERILVQPIWRLFAVTYEIFKCTFKFI